MGDDELHPRHLAVEMGHVGTSLKRSTEVAFERSTPVPPPREEQLRRRKLTLAGVAPGAADDDVVKGGSGGVGSGANADPEATKELAISQVEWYINRLKYKKNKSLMYKLLVAWLFGVVCSCIILFLIRDAPKTFQMVNCFNELLVTEPFDFADSPTLKNFREINNEYDFWAFVHGPLLAGVSNVDANGKVMMCVDNRLLGTITMRQHRVRKGVGFTNHLAALMAAQQSSAPEALSDDCFPPYSADVRSEDPYGPGGVWTFERTKSPSAAGYLSSYEGDGFVVRLSADPATAAQQIQFLENNSWIDQHTRAVVISIKTFNPSINSFLSSVFLTEFAPGGNTMMDVSMRPLLADFYLTGTDWFRCAVEIAFLLWLVGHVFLFVYVIIAEIKARRSIITWIMNPWWNFIGLLSLVLYTIASMWYIIMLARNHAWVNSIQSLDDDQYFEDLESFAQYHLFWMYFSIVSVVAGIISIFRYLNFNPRMSLLWLTIERAGGDLVTFVLFFLIVFGAFVIAGHLLYGTAIFSFSSLSWAILEGLRGVFGQFNYEDMVDVQRYITPVYFVLFMLIMIFVLLNMFIAIINDAYGAVNEEAGATPTLATSLRKSLTKLAAKIRGISHPTRVPSISTSQLLFLLKRLKSRIRKEKLTKSELARWPGFQDMPDGLFERVWSKLSSVTATTKMEEQKVGLGESDSDDELEEYEDEGDDEESAAAAPPAS